jgi:hypothetical protein
VLEKGLGKKYYDTFVKDFAIYGGILNEKHGCLIYIKQKKKKKGFLPSFLPFFLYIYIYIYIYIRFNK